MSDPIRGKILELVRAEHYRPLKPRQLAKSIAAADEGSQRRAAASGSACAVNWNDAPVGSPSTSAARSASGSHRASNDIGRRAVPSIIVSFHVAVAP